MPFCLNNWLKNFPGYKDVSDDDLKCIHDRFHLLVHVARAQGRVHPDYVGEIIKKKKKRVRVSLIDP